MREFFEGPSRIELLQRHIRDSAVHEAMGTHIGRLRGEEITQGLVNEIAQLAVHNGLLAYSSHLQMEIARIESFERMQMDEARLRPSPTMVADLMAAMQGRPSKEEK